MALLSARRAALVVGPVGPPGADGPPGPPSPGPPGTSGVNAFTQLAASFTQPAVNGTVSALVQNSSWMAVGQTLFIVGGGYYKVSSLPDGTHAVIQNLGSPGNASPSTTVNGPAVVAAGSPGATGTAGKNAYTTTTANFTQPAVNGTVSASVGDTSWMVAGQTLFVATGGYYTVNSITDSVTVVLTNTGDTGNASPTTVINSPQGVSPGGVQGVQGPSGASGGTSYTNTTANFTQPAVSATVSVQMGSTAWMTANEIVYVAGGGYYQISSVTDATHAVLTNLGYTGNAAPTTVINSGALVGPSGIKGADGTNGTNGTNGVDSFTTTAANFTQPASGSTVSVQVGITAWMVATQVVYVATGGYYSVNSITDATHVVLKNLGYTGNAAPTTTINSGSGMSPGGLIGPSGGGGATSNVGLASARPSATGSGSIYLCSDIPVMYVDDPTAVAWQQFAITPVLDPPPVKASYSTFGNLFLNQYADSLRATLSHNVNNAAGSGLVSSGSLGAGSTWMVTFAGSVNTPASQSFPEMGVAIFDGNTSGTSNLYAIIVYGNGGSYNIHQEKSTLAGGRISTNNEVQINPTSMGSGRLINLRILNDGTNTHYQHSSDGMNWWDLFTETAHSGIVYYGFVMGGNGGSSNGLAVGNVYKNAVKSLTVAQATIIDATNASPIVVQTSAAHNFQDGDVVANHGVGGNTNANNGTGSGPLAGGWQIEVVDSTHFKLIGSSGNAAYTSGGTATLLSR